MLVKSQTGITTDSTGAVIINPINPVTTTLIILSETGAVICSEPGNIEAEKYSLKSYPFYQNGTTVLIDSIVLKDFSGLYQKWIYITAMD